MADRADSGISPVKFLLTQNISYSLSCNALLFFNWQRGDNFNNVSLLHHFRYRSELTDNRSVAVRNSFTHELGIQYFFDSISRFLPDENTLDTQVDVRMGKNFSMAVFSSLTTRLFNSYRYTAGSAGNLIRNRSASFLTPMLWTLSSGFGYAFPHLGSLSLGLSAVRLTWIRDREVYRQQNLLEFYGVPKDKSFMIEYGFSLHLLVDRDFLKRIHWDCDLLIFKNYRKPVDMVMKNLIEIRISKFIKTTIQTQLYYEKEVSKTLQVMNMVSLGFYFIL
ncbi:MAG: DUF3078 domain-containing protein [Bacteroidetes bacterium]|nr:DUF3078 domain-containing protein [Bacteroidota bacterium]